MALLVKYRPLYHHDCIQPQFRQLHGRLAIFSHVVHVVNNIFIVVYLAGLSDWVNGSGQRTLVNTAGRTAI
jgi:hypothetical protein